MTLRVDVIPKPPYPQPVLVVDVFYGSVVGALLSSGAREVWVAKSVRAAQILAEGGGLLLGEQEGFPPEGFHAGVSLQILPGLGVKGKTCVLLAPPLAESLEQVPLESTLAYFRNARAVVAYAAEQNIGTVVAATQARLEPSLANTVAAGFIAKRLHQSLGGVGDLQGGGRMAMALLKSFPDPQESLVQSDMGELLYRAGRSEELALSSLVSVEELTPKLKQVKRLEARQYGLTKDRFGFCFQAR
ncbi:MAG: 2-phosphosulfolactate phosphatase [Meiothermus sp.]|uniref:2-phosphosulfolactate phosphatase n=1 Tax=Meiothermus sp. TaxID=1955249 RepID=UPI0021DDE538|nr:2-phosphosulfolactate phosphatase [Meiothermus sp.]GIW27433.1 MAG: 2-phosphosulfolactate phosphatase [Meiothermus sp.]